MFCFFVLFQKTHLAQCFLRRSSCITFFCLFEYHNLYHENFGIHFLNRWNFFDSINWKYENTCRVYLYLLTVLFGWQAIVSVPLWTARWSDEFFQPNQSCPYPLSRGNRNILYYYLSTKYPVSKLIHGIYVLKNIFLFRNTFNSWQQQNNN